MCDVFNVLLVFGCVCMLYYDFFVLVVCELVVVVV